MRIVFRFLLIFWCWLFCQGKENISSLLSPNDMLSFFRIDDGVFYIWGSYFDHRSRSGELSPDIIGPPPYVRILMMGKFDDNFPKKLQQSSCEFYYEEFSSSPIKMPVVGVFIAKVDDIYPENMSRPYFVYCKVPKGTPSPPRSLSFLLYGADRADWNSDKSGSPRKWLIPINGNFNAPSNNFTDRKLMVCVKPLQGLPYVDMESLFNFLVGVTTLGAQHIVIYDSGCGSPKFYKMLNMARDMGVSIEVEPWNFRDTHGWMLCQTIASELCLHKGIDLGYENVMTIDLDELIIPHADINGKNSPTYIDLLEYLDIQYPDAAYYRFIHSYFPMTMLDSSNASSRMISLRKTWHYPPHMALDRSKCIYKPHRMGEIFTHFGKPCNQSYKEVVIPPDLGLMHHYRNSVRNIKFKASQDFSVPLRYSENFTHNDLYQVLYPLVYSK